MMKQVIISVLLLIGWYIASILCAVIFKNEIHTFVGQIYLDFNSNVIVSDITAPMTSPLKYAVSLVIASMAAPIVIILLLLFKSKASIIGALFVSMIIALTLYISYVYATAILFEYEYAHQLPIVQLGVFAFFGTVSIGVLYIYLERKSVNKALQPTAKSSG